jgi:hypothetical protein
LIPVAWEVCVAVDVEGDADDDVGVVNAGEKTDQSGCFGKNELLGGEFNIDVEVVLKGEEKDGMVLGFLEDRFVVSDDSCGDGSRALIYLGLVRYD